MDTKAICYFFILEDEELLTTARFFPDYDNGSSLNHWHGTGITVRPLGHPFLG